MIIFNDVNKETKKMFPYIVQLGCGANGGYLVQMVAQMLNIFNIKGFYLIVDPDIVESKNLGNQLFLPRDVSHKKADVLAKRYRNAYNIPIGTFTERFIEDEGMLRQLFNQTDYLVGWNRRMTFLPILIGCVDNNYSRQVMHRYFEQQDTLLYLDLGVEGAWVPQDGRERKTWSSDEIRLHKETGYTGQVACGLRWKGETILSDVAMLHPNILADEDEIAPSETSCSNVVVNEPQRLITNRYAAMTAAMYLNELFSDATITNHESFLVLNKGLIRTTQVREEIILR